MENIQFKNNQAFSQFNGLTKREYIATKVLAGLLASCNSFPNTNYVISQAIESTDELMKQLSETK